MKSVLTVASLLSCAFVATLSFAAPPDAPGVDRRQQNQEQRIEQGIRSGELTPKEAGRLEAQQARIQQTEQTMKSDGKLTRNERRKLHAMQDRSSDAIYRKKHNKRRLQVQ